MLKIKLYYDLPEYNPEVHDPDRVFRLLTYRGVTYAKWVDLKSRGVQNWEFKKRGWETSLFLYLCKKAINVYYDTLRCLDNTELGTNTCNETSTPYYELTFRRVNKCTTYYQEAN